MSTTAGISAPQKTGLPMFVGLASIQSFHEDWNYEPIDDVSLSVGPKCCAGDSWSRSSTTTLS